MSKRILYGTTSLCALALMLHAQMIVAAVNGATSSSSTLMYKAGIYHYGPSIIMNTNGTGDAWFCGPGVQNAGDWDNIYHKSTSDNGITWTNDTAVLWPTNGSNDTFSTCDPGVIYFGGYYYIGYTSTADIRGFSNQTFVARSTSPTGPWDKWNGSGWDLAGTTQSPFPFVSYSDGHQQYGVGEPSLVIQNGTLYVYYSYLGVTNGAPVIQTRVITTDPSNRNWPGAVAASQAAGRYSIAMDKTQYNSADSADVKYVDSYEKFLAVTTARRFGPSAYLQFWESTDGLTFVPSDVNANSAFPYLHNAGLSGDASGHIDASWPYNFVGYAYGAQWAYWDTSANPVTYANNNLPAPPRMNGATPANGSVNVSFTTSPSVVSYTLNYGTQSGVYTTQMTGLTAGSANVAASVNVTGLTNGTRYYFSLTSTNANGTSENSEEIYATPQHFATLSITNSSSSSVSGTLYPSLSYDGNPATFFSSKEYVRPGGYCCASYRSSEWVQWDLGSPQSLARMTFTDRAFGSGGPEFGRHVQLLGSNDGTNYFALNYRDNFTGATSTLPTPVAVRYIKLAADELTEDDNGNFYLQVSEVKFEGVGYAAFASSYLTGWEPYHVIGPDVTGTTGDYSSIGHASAVNTEWAALDLGTPQTVTGLNVTPRPTGAGFPVDFSIQYSSDGVNWTNLTGQSYTNYPNPGSALTAFRFSAPITAQYFRVYATKLGADSYNNYYLQLAHLDPDYAPLYTLSASSSIPGWAPSSAGDGNPATNWSSAGHSSANNAEWIQLDFGSTIAVSSLRLFPRTGNCFPSALTIQYSNDNVSWTTAPGQSYSSFSDPAQANNIDNVAADPLFVFKGGIQARYVRITGTTLRPDSFGNYYFQLQDIVVNPDGVLP